MSNAEKCEVCRRTDCWSCPTAADIMERDVVGYEQGMERRRFVNALHVLERELAEIPDRLWGPVKGGSRAR